MTYRQGEIILASDFNSFRTTLLNVYDVGNGDAGYGQIDTGGQVAIPSRAVNDPILSDEWDKFLTAAETCRAHQGSTTDFPPNAEVAAGELVEAHEFLDSNVYDIDSSLVTITANRLIADAGSVTVFSNALNSIRNTSWGTQLVHLFRVTFPTVDDARYFFNSGGQIRFRGSRSGGSGSAQNASWTALLNNMASITFDYTQTTAPGSWFTGSSIGYYDLTTSFQQLATGTPMVGSGYYYYYDNVNNVTLFGRTVDGTGGLNADNGRILEFRMEYNDAHVNVFDDTVDGTITSDIDYRKATSPLVIQDPVFATITGLTSGS